MADSQLSGRRGARKSPSAIRVENGLAYVSLTRGLEAIIDAADVDVVAGYRWTCLASRTMGGHAYAARIENGRCILMHRQLLDAPAQLKVGHKDGDGLNNRRCNIRTGTSAQIQANKVVECRNKIGIKGVSLSKSGCRFRAVITPNGKKVHLGWFATSEEAAQAYNAAAKSLWGDHARSESGERKKRPLPPPTRRYRTAGGVGAKWGAP